MFRVLKLLKVREWIFALLAVGLIVLQVWLDLTMPDYMATITRSPSPAVPPIWGSCGRTARSCSPAPSAAR